MPCVDMLRPSTQQVNNEGDDESAMSSAADMELYLPEALPPRQRSLLDPKLLGKYRKLHLAQAEDAMNAMKRRLRKGATLWKHKKDHTAGTGVAANTRMLTAIAKQESKTQLDAERYRVACMALFELCPAGKWKKCLLELAEHDTTARR